jgi:hypothetical protein
MNPTANVADLGLLAVAAAIGALFGAIWWRPVKRYGSWLVVCAWLLSSLVLAALAALRATLLVSQATAPVLFDWSPLQFLFEYGAAVGFTLVPVAIGLQWRGRRRPQSALAAIALTSGAWALAGFIAMSLIAGALHLSAFAFVASG